jgi:hypothetical protein
MSEISINIRIKDPKRKVSKIILVNLSNKSNSNSHPWISKLENYLTQITIKTNTKSKVIKIASRHRKRLHGFGQSWDQCFLKNLDSKFLGNQK